MLQLNNIIVPGYIYGRKDITEWVNSFETVEKKFQWIPAIHRNLESA